MPQLIIRLGESMDIVKTGKEVKIEFQEGKEEELAKWLEAIATSIRLFKVLPNHVITEKDDNHGKRKSDRDRPEERKEHRSRRCR